MDGGRAKKATDPRGHFAAEKGAAPLKQATTAEKDLRVVALVPLRGGSKSIPKKNIKQIAGKPLFFWVTDACRRSGLFESVVVSTDSKEIAASVRTHFSDVEILERPPDLAQDTTSTEAVMLHFADHYSFDYLCTVQATSPLLQPDDLQRGWDRVVRHGYDSIVSCVRFRRFIWSADGRPLNYDPQKRPRRQDNDGVFLENGAFYFTRRETLVKTRCRLGGEIGIAEMSEESAIELDEPNDWLMVEQLMEKGDGGNL